MARRGRPPKIENQLKGWFVLFLLGGCIFIIQAIGSSIANLWESSIGKIILIGVPLLLFFIWIRKKTQNQGEQQNIVPVITGLGFDISKLSEFKAYKPFIDSAIQKNLSQIKNLDDNTLQQIAEALFLAIQNGWSIAQLKNEIMGTGRVDKEQAESIARNGIRAVQSALNQKRAVDVGFKTYTWLTAEDQRVRGNPNGLYPDAKPNCWIMHGLLCRYDDDTVYSNNGGKTWKKRTPEMPKGKPGEDEDCRCCDVVEDT